MTHPLTKDQLRQFIGTETWYRHSLVRQVLYTEGAQFLAEKGGAYWLLDEIALSQKYQPEVAAEPFQLWKLTVREDRTATLACQDGNCRTVFAKNIAFTDFPLSEISLYFCDRTILLPSEY